MEPGVIKSAINSLRQYLTPAQKRYGIWMVLLLLINSFLDVFGLAALIPIIMVAAKPMGVFNNKYFFFFYSSLGFHSEQTFLVVLILVIFAFFLAKNLFSVWSSNLQIRFTADIGLGLINKQLDKYLNFPVWYLNDMGHAKVTNSSTNVPTAYVGGILRPLLVLISEVAVVAVIAISIALYKPLLILMLGLILAPTTLLLYRGLRTRSLLIGTRMNELGAQASGKMHDIFIGYTELKLAGKIPQFRSEVYAGQQEMQKLMAESYLYSQLPVKVIELIAILGVVVIFLFALLSKNGSTELITLIGLFAAAAYRLMPSVNRMLTALMQIKQNQFSLTELERFTEARYNEAMHPEQQPLNFSDNISFNRVGFTFTGEMLPALQDVNLVVRKGEKIGLIGSSGSGKTTLMNILLRFYKESKGSISVDEVPLTPRNLQAWHRIVGYVKQDTFLIEASIRDNVTLNDAVVNEERLNYALEQASLSAFINTLPNGADTHIGERGSKLSGGQRQRIGIARALYKQTQVLVLDEATSALDNQTEREVSEAISRLSLTDITIFVVAHRITTLRDCDRIFELKAGRLVSERSYADLVKETI